MFVAECEQCGLIARGGFEEVGDAAEDHEQFHDVRVSRVATDGGEDCYYVVESTRDSRRILTRPYKTEFGALIAARRHGTNYGITTAPAPGAVVGVGP